MTDSIPDRRSRRISLRGSHNFRDVGGYRSANGQTVRWELLYRSDDLGGLGAGDLDHISRLNLQSVCDLRSPGERESRPDRLPLHNPPSVIYLPIDASGTSPAEVREVILSGAARSMDFECTMKRFYRDMAASGVSQFATLFQLLSDPTRRPLLIHCVGGKDRTGVAIALFLLALGVPLGTVFSDYLATNTYSVRRIQHTILMVRLFSCFRCGPAQMRPLLEARQEYLQIAFDQMMEMCGSVDGYLRNALGVTEANRARLRDLWLE